VSTNSTTRAIRRTDKRHRRLRTGKKIDFTQPVARSVCPAIVNTNALAQIRAEKMIGLVGADLGMPLIDCARALSAGGINSLEIAMTTPAAIDLLGKAHAALPDFCFGLGTVLDVDTARLGIIAGASFIVTPSPRPEVIMLCRRYHVPVICGAFTASDITTAHSAGASAAKVFPGELFGPAYIRTLKQQMPHIDMIPIGGVTPQTVAEFLRAGAMATIAGSSLIEEVACGTADWERVTGRAREFVKAVEAASAS
jgi:2-dehydro-3-deoxyphosphogluconate aldolase/(4S)-4-hydroxy-2-oxoglutarate aldolase